MHVRKLIEKLQEAEKLAPNGYVFLGRKDYNSTSKTEITGIENYGTDILITRD